jgi:hypothetical protein
MKRGVFGLLSGLVLAAQIVGMAPAFAEDKRSAEPEGKALCTKEIDDPFSGAFVRKSIVTLFEKGAKITQLYISRDADGKPHGGISYHYNVTAEGAVVAPDGKKPESAVRAEVIDVYRRAQELCAGVKTESAPTAPDAAAKDAGAANGFNPVVYNI